MLRDVERNMIAIATLCMVVVICSEAFYLHDNDYIITVLGAGFLLAALHLRSIKLTIEEQNEILDNDDDNYE